jgi:hypothetical protein
MTAATQASICQRDVSFWPALGTRALGMMPLGDNVLLFDTLLSPERVDLRVFLAEFN